MSTVDNGSWFVDLLMKLAPEDLDIGNKTPEQLTSEASWKAFGLTTAASFPPGPFGWATLLPELVGLTKLQINLIYAIAKYYGKTGQFNQRTVLYIFGSQAGIALGRTMMRNVGGKVIVRAISSKIILEIAAKVGAKMGARMLAKAAGRWIPFILAPIFGAFSKSMTTAIGEEAQKLFSNDLEMEDESDLKTCSQGHTNDSIARFCNECGEKL